MQGLLAVYRKELADHFSSYRFIILFALIAMVGFITSYMVGLNLREHLEGIVRPKFIFLMLFTHFADYAARFKRLLFGESMIYMPRAIREPSSIASIIKWGSLQSPMA